MLTINNLSYAYKRNKPILHNVSFSLNPGITLLVGENGSGKSTLIKVLTSALPSKEPILIDGQEMSDIMRKKRMAYLPQEFDIYPSLKVCELLRFVANSKGVEKNNVPAKIHEVAERVNVEKILNKKVKQCSVGTRRRIGIAASLLGDPEIVILDEPTAGIDPKERARFYQTINECFSDKIVLIATHILDDIEILANYVLMLSHGRITYNGSYSEFRHSLDECMYQLESSILTDVEVEFINKGMILSQKKNQEMTIYRIAATNPPNSILENCKKVFPTLEDLWEYYQRINNNG